jgi:hypothetical protein
MKSGAWNKNGCWPGLSSKDVLRVAQPCDRNLSAVGVKLHPRLVMPRASIAPLESEVIAVGRFWGKKPIVVFWAVTCELVGLPLQTSRSSYLAGIAFSQCWPYTAAVLATHIRRIR